MSELENKLLNLSRVMSRRMSSSKARNLLLFMLFVRFAAKRSFHDNAIAGKGGAGMKLRFDAEYYLNQADNEVLTDVHSLNYTKTDFFVFFYPLLEELEKEYTLLGGSYSELGLERILKSSLLEVYICYLTLEEIKDLNFSEYAEGFDLVIKFFSEKVGRNITFSTPDSVRKIYKGILGNVHSVLDPACGSGSLLDIFAKDENCFVFGQDINAESLALAQLRLAFYSDVQLSVGDSLNNLNLEIRRTDAVVMNPPFSLRIDEKTLKHAYYLKYDVSKHYGADMLWLQLALHHIDKHGKALVVLANRSLSSFGGEEEIRKQLIEEGLVEAIISLPARLFPYTSIPVSIWILSKQRLVEDKVLLIDVFESGVSTNRFIQEIPDEIIKQIVDTYESWSKGLNTSGLSSEHVVSVAFDEIRANDYSLVPSRYLPMAGTEEEDLTEAVELSELLKRKAPLQAKLEVNKICKKLSIKNLASNTDQFLVDISSLELSSTDSEKRVYDGDLLLIARSGDKLKPSYLPFKDGQVFSLMNVYPFDVDTSKVRMDYLVQELNKKYVENQVSRYRTGAVIPTLRIKDFLSVRIWLPSLEEQKEAVQEEREIRFEGLAKLHGFENQIKQLKEQQQKDLGSKKHNIMQHLNNVKSSNDILRFMLEKNNGVLRAQDIINPKTGVTVLQRFKRLNESIENVLFYVDNLTNEIEFGKCEDCDAYQLVKECVEKGRQSSKFVFTDNSDLETFKEQKPIVSVSKKDFEELYNNILENAILHGFIEDRKYEFKYSVLIANNKVEVLFENNGKPFPRGMGTKSAYMTRGEKAGITANTGEGSWKVSQIVDYFDAELEVFDNPDEDFPVGIKIIFDLIQ